MKFVCTAKKNKKIFREINTLVKNVAFTKLFVNKVCVRVNISNFPLVSIVVNSVNPLNRASTHGPKVEGNSKITNFHETWVV